jgi:hypothetical protein
MNISRDAKRTKQAKVPAIGIVEQRAQQAVLHSAQMSFRMSGRRALTATSIEAIALIALLNPITGRALFERKPWSLTLLAVFFAVHLAWMIMVACFGKAWSHKHKIQRSLKT